MAKGIKTGGRKKGTPNKITAEIKELITEFINGNFEQMQKDFESLDSRERVKFYIDLLPYALPKLRAVETTDNTEQKNKIIFQNISKEYDIDSEGNSIKK